MRGNWVNGAVVGLVGLLLVGCGSTDTGSDDDPVPTMSVRPSPSAPATTESGFTVSADPTADATDATDAPSEPKTSSAGQQSPDPAPVDLGTAPTSYTQAAAYVAKVRADGGQQQLRAFRTPEDIYCLMTSDFLKPACELPQGAGVDDAQACRNTMGDRVGRVELADRRVRPVCNTDTIRDSVPPTVEPLGVVTNSASGLACAVAEIGVTCVHEGRKVGFFLGLDSYAVFG